MLRLSSELFRSRASPDIVTEIHKKTAAARAPRTHRRAAAYGRGPAASSRKGGGGLGGRCCAKARLSDFSPAIQSFVLKSSIQNFLRCLLADRISIKLLPNLSSYQLFGTVLGCSEVFWVGLAKFRMLWDISYYFRM